MNRKTFFKRGLAAIVGIFFGARAAAAPANVVIRNAWGTGWQVPRFTINPEWITSPWWQVRLPSGRDVYMFAGISDTGEARAMFNRWLKHENGGITGMRAMPNVDALDLNRPEAPAFLPVEPFIRLPDGPAS